MDLTADDIRQMTPWLRKAAKGWLAMSGPGAALRIAVMGASEAEAREAFREAAAAWATLHEREAGRSVT
jgi:hypothetical protein